MARTLRLARDRISPIESHLEELSARSGITLFVLVRMLRESSKKRGEEQRFHAKT